MRILILNWRDIKNPSGGGAEILTHEIAKRWSSNGYSVTQFSAAFKGSKKRETFDGVNFIRKGKWFTVHILALIYYLKNRNKYDVIIDEVHWFPFFAAIYSPNKTIALTCEVASKLFFKIFPYPIALIFLSIEKLSLFLYRSVPTMVISPSTRDELIAAGHKNENIIVLPMGLSRPKNLLRKPKEKTPVIISVGRLNRQKGTLDVIDAFAYINKSFPESNLWLLGSGEGQFMMKIKERITSYGLQNHVKLYGFVSEEEKFMLLSKATILVSASVQEGWGLTIPEAGLVHTPAVVYNVQGFRDVIEHNKDGIFVEKTPTHLANETVKLLRDKKKYEKMQVECYKKAKTYTWDNTADTALTFMTKTINSI